MKFNQTLTACVKANLSTKRVPMLLGEPGIGKSSWAIDLGREMNTKVFVLACNQLADKTDLTGARLVPITDETGATISYKQVFYPHSVIYDAIQYANEHQNEEPILFLDEINRTTSDVTSALLSIPTLRAIGDCKLPDNLRIIIAGNDKGNVIALDDASISRFVLYHTEPDLMTFFDVNDNLNPYVERTLRAHPELIFCKQIVSATTNDADEEENDMLIDDIVGEYEEMKQFTSPRTIMAASAFLNQFNNQQLTSLLSDVTQINGENVSALQEALEGHTGKTPFTVFLLAEITGSLMSNSNMTTVQITKPASYVQLDACSTISEMNDMLQTIDDKEKGALLVYALYAKKDHTILLSVLSPQLNAIENNDAKTLMQLVNADQLNPVNVRAFLKTDADIARTLRVILDACDV